MAISINPITPVIAADAASPSVTLQPGSVIDAKVLQVLANDFVRIAVASLSIEVASEVPLQVGQALQLAVSQTPDGVRLQIVPQTTDTSSQAQPATLVSPSIAPNASSATSDAQGVSVTRPLTPLEVVAVAKALQTAAGQQGSLSPLFANLTVAATSGHVPDVLQQAAHSLLAGRPALTEKLSGEDIATAFRQSGLFYEQSQKQAVATPVVVPASVAATPDLKAALIVFRQILGSWLGGATQPPPDDAAVPGQFAQQGQARAQAEIAAPSIAPAAMSAAEVEEIMLPGAVVEMTSEVEVEDLGDPVFPARDPSSSLLLGKSGTASSAETLQMILRAFPKGVQDAVISQLAEEGVTLAQSAAASHGVAADTDGVPPPFRGAATSAQPAVPPTIDHRTPPDAVAHRLLDDTDAALARQTLLQIASLPEQATHAKFDPTARWNFEIPFATPQGTAVAQFEISRDGGGEAASAEAASRVWRARFSINLEPAGPVHAQVSLAGERTSVRMWAERSATVARLQAEASQLSQALREAELTPGDIVIGSGAPSAQPAPSGHFLDRAL